MLGGPYSDVSSLLESGQTTEDGCEGDISDSDNDCSDWLQDFELVEPFLPEFWLILRVSSGRVDTFFHCRCVVLNEVEFLALSRGCHTYILWFGVAS